MNYLKKLKERREKLMQEAEAIFAKAEEEKRAMTDEEVKAFDEKAADIESVDKTIETLNTKRKFQEETKKEEKKDPEKKEGKGELEEKRSMDMVRGLLENEEYRAGEMSGSSLDAVQASEFSKDIVKAVNEISNIAADVANVTVKGVYKQIARSQKMTSGWGAELSEVTASDAKYTVLPIGHDRLGALAIISNEAVSDTDFNITAEVQEQIKESLAESIENAIFNGDGEEKPTGLSTSGTAKQWQVASTITADELIDIRYGIKKTYHKNAKWKLNRPTLTAIQKLKDKNDRYLFNNDITNEYDGYILGKPVEITESLSDYEICFGDFKNAYKTNTAPDVSFQILREKYATQGAIGILVFMHIGGKPINPEAYIFSKNPA